MTFSEFKNSISKIENFEVLGEQAHLQMAPNFRKTELEQLDIEAKNPKEAGVMALFYPNSEEETCLTLILRKTYKGVHSAQIGFPGGRREKKDGKIRFGNDIMGVKRPMKLRGIDLFND